MLNDIRYAPRMLHQNPGFAFTAIISIAIAIGANSAIFSMADALLLRPLPVAKASEIVTVRATGPSGRLVNMSSGIATGIILSFFAARGINAGLTATLEGVRLPIVNTTVFATIPVALLTTTLLAAAIPARRASRIDPQQALRQE